MKISLLMEREPFDKIFEETFTSFLNDLTNSPHKVKWYPRNHKKQKTVSVQRWYCNSLINSIFVNGAKPTVFDSISGEYSYNPLRPWRSLIQKLYLNFSRYPITGPSLSKYIIEISPPINDAINKLIIGGNTKIRMIDIADRNVYVILKSGFQKKYLDREIYVRNNFRYLPIPKIHSYGKNGKWYCEDYIVGSSPDRIKGSIGQVILNIAIEHIHKMLNETKNEESLLDYVGLVQERIKIKISQISHIDSIFEKKILSVTSELINLLNNYSGYTIITAYSHGDFQEGNILHDGEKTWILDWEYSNKRQIGYDLFVLLLKSRVYKGFSNRFLKLINNDLDEQQIELLNNWPGIKWKTKPNNKIHLLLFLLEEIDFHLGESNNKNFYKTTSGLTAIICHVNDILTINKFNSEN